MYYKITVLKAQIYFVGGKCLLVVSLATPGVEELIRKI
jgi:hypothetical protein